MIVCNFTSNSVESLGHSLQPDQMLLISLSHFLVSLRSTLLVLPVLSKVTQGERFHRNHASRAIDEK